MRRPIYRRPVTAVLIAAVFFCAACARKPAPLVASFGAGTEELLARTRQLNQAFALRDARTIETLLAPEYTFHYTDHMSRGALQATPNAPRGRWIGKAFDQLTNGPLASAIVDARVHGETGITITHYKWQGAWNGVPFQYEGYITDTWIRRGGKWELLTSSANLMPSPM
jgi:hypothetical protein